MSDSEEEMVNGGVQQARPAEMANERVQRDQPAIERVQRAVPENNVKNDLVEHDLSGKLTTLVFILVFVACFFSSHGHETLQSVFQVKAIENYFGDISFPLLEKLKAVLDSKSCLSTVPELSKIYLKNDYDKFYFIILYLLGAVPFIVAFFSLLPEQVRLEYLPRDFRGLNAIRKTRFTVAAVIRLIFVLILGSLCSSFSLLALDSIHDIARSNLLIRVNVVVQPTSPNCDNGLRIRFNKYLTDVASLPGSTIGTITKPKTKETLFWNGVEPPPPSWDSVPSIVGDFKVNLPADSVEIVLLQLLLQNSKLTVRNEQLEQRITDHDKRIFDLENQLIGMNNALYQLDQKGKVIETNITTLSTEAKNHGKRIVYNEQNISSLSMVYEYHHVRIDQFNAIIADLSIVSKQHDGKIRILETNTTTLFAEADDFAKRIAKNEGSISSLFTANQNQDQKIGQSIASIDGLSLVNKKQDERITATRVKVVQDRLLFDPEVRWDNPTNPFRASTSGNRATKAKVAFPPGTFSSPPKILISPAQMSVSHDYPLRYSVAIKVVSSKGFEVELSSWHDAVFFSLHFDYIAIGE
jgi:TolA-binding protein